MKAIVQRHGDQTRMGDAEEGLEEARAVGRDHGDPVAGRQPAIEQRAGHPRHPVGDGRPVGHRSGRADEGRPTRLRRGARRDQ